MKNSQRIKQEVQFKEKRDSSGLKPYREIPNLSNYSVKCKLRNKNGYFFNLFDWQRL